MLGEALQELLAADPDITEIVADRIYPRKGPQGDPFPLITYQVVSKRRLQGLEGRAGLTSARVRIIAWALSYRECDGLAKLIAREGGPLDQQKVSAGGLSFQGILLDEEAEVFDQELPAEDGVVYGIAADFAAWFEE
jgi:hypothetical protein